MSTRAPGIKRVQNRLIRAGAKKKACGSQSRSERGKTVQAVGGKPLKCLLLSQGVIAGE